MDAIWSFLENVQMPMLIRISFLFWGGGGRISVSVCPETPRIQHPNANLVSRLGR
jgi:hypothetical protein